MSTSPEILAKQAAYAALPFAAYVNSSHFSGSFRFATEAQAIEYLFQSYARTKGYIASSAMGRDWTGWDARRSYLERPGQEIIQARYVLMAESLSS